jgi:hypothetical protein
MTRQLCSKQQQTSPFRATYCGYARIQAAWCTLELCRQCAWRAHHGALAQRVTHLIPPGS